VQLQNRVLESEFVAEGQTELAQRNRFELRADLGSRAHIGIDNHAVAMRLRMVACHAFHQRAGIVQVIVRDDRDDCLAFHWCRCILSARILTDRPTMHRSRYVPLPDALRASLFLPLATTGRAGLPAVQAFGLLKLPSPGRERLELAQRLVQRGAAPAEASYRSGLFSPYEWRLVQAALAGGDPTLTYHRLATRYEAAVNRRRKFRSKMVFPLVTLVIGLFVMPLPGLAGGQVTPGVYLWRASAPL